MDPVLFLANLQARDDHEGQLVVSRKLPARKGRDAALSRPLTGRVAQAMHHAGIDRLYLHQAVALDRLRDGSHTIVATGTATGKSLCYQLPILEAIAGRPAATALYVGPTKALAQDQLRQLDRFAATWLRPEIYDGDTPTSQRAGIRRHANILLTNPDMLHVGILPNHELWAGFLRNLAVVVIDEAHAFRGVFGSHVALIMRRLRRISEGLGARPVHALASATIGNPAEHASALTGLAVGAVDADHAPRGPRHVAFWNPPLRADSDGRRQSSNYETARLLADLVEQQSKTIAFSKSRVAAELVARYARDRLGDRRDSVAVYRAGFLSSERREIEQGLQADRYTGVSATNALELGIDVGDLDAVVLNGFPGTVASAWQQAGRAGRAGQPSLAIVVPQDEPLDQYYAAHPQEFFAKPHEAALVNPSNPFVLRMQLGCAAYERPLAAADAALFGASSVTLAQQMRDDGDLRERRGRLYWSRRRPPASDVDIRSAGGAPYRIVEHGTGRVIGTVDDARAHQTVHPGAIYLHQNETYRVVDLVLDDRVALVAEDRPAEYTQALTHSDLEVLTRDHHLPLQGCVVALGAVRVTEQVIGYQRRRLQTGEVISSHDLDLPPQTLVTRAVWYVVASGVLDRCLRGLEGGDDAVLLGSLHAAEHAAIGILPVLAMCDRWDIGGLSTNLHPDTGDPTIFIYDGYPMGAGIADHAFEHVGQHLATTAGHVRECPCSAGCPSCVQSPKCGNANEPLHKHGAVRVLDTIARAVGRSAAPAG